VRFDFAVFISTFLFILPAELPDKSFIMTLVLATKQPRSAVWLGASIAFGIQAAIAVTAGSLLTRLPRELVVSIVLLIFCAGAAFLFRESWKERRHIGVDAEEIVRNARRLIGFMPSD